MKNEIIKGIECENCGDDIVAMSYWDNELQERITDYGYCINCYKRIILPGENFNEFVIKNCW